MLSRINTFEASVRVNGSAVTEVLYNGRTYVEGRKNSEYELFFRNNSSKKVMVVPSVDGLSVLNGKLAGVNSPGFVVEPHQSLVVPGWKVDNKTAAKFEFRPVGDKSNQTYIESLKSDGVDVDKANQGLIGFLVFEEKEQFDWNAIKSKIDYDTIKLYHTSAAPYYDITNTTPGFVAPQGFGICGSVMSDGNVTSESIRTLSINSLDTPLGYRSAAATTSQTSAQVGTGFGSATDFKTKKVEFEKKNPKTPDDILIIEYDTVQGLKARGVPVEMFRTNTMTANRSAFPASPELTNTGCKPPKGWNK